MKPWIFWTGKVPLAEFPDTLAEARIIVVAPDKYVIEASDNTSAFGERIWFDNFEMGMCDPAKVMETCLLSLIARRNSLGWIPRAEMPAQPTEDDEAEPQISQISDNSSEADDDPQELTMTRLGEQTYRKRCSEKWTHAGVVNELQRNSARGRILRAFTTGVGQCLRATEIAKSAQCSATTVSNYCHDYEAAGWMEDTKDGWKLTRTVPDVKPTEIPAEPAWTKRQDLHPDLNEEDRRELESGRSNLRPESKPPVDLKVNSTNGHAPINSSAPLVERVVDVLSRGPQTFDKLAGLLVVGIKPLTTALADLASDGTVTMRGGKYQLDEST